MKFGFSVKAWKFNLIFTVDHRIVDFFGFPFPTSEWDIYVYYNMY